MAAFPVLRPALRDAHDDMADGDLRPVVIPDEHMTAALGGDFRHGPLAFTLNEAEFNARFMPSEPASFRPSHVGYHLAGEDFRLSPSNIIGEALEQLFGSNSGPTQPLCRMVLYSLYNAWPGTIRKLANDLAGYEWLPLELVDNLSDIELVEWLWLVCNDNSQSYIFLHKGRNFIQLERDSLVEAMAHSRTMTSDISYSSEKLTRVQMLWCLARSVEPSPPLLKSAGPTVESDILQYISCVILTCSAELIRPPHTRLPSPYHKLALPFVSKTGRVDYKGLAKELGAFLPDDRGDTIKDWITGEAYRYFGLKKTLPRDEVHEDMLAVAYSDEALIAGLELERAVIASRIHPRTGIRSAVLGIAMDRLNCVNMSMVRDKYLANGNISLTGEVRGSDPADPVFSVGTAICYVGATISELVTALRVGRQEDKDPFNPMYLGHIPKVANFAEGQDQSLMTDLLTNKTLSVTLLKRLSTLISQELAPPLIKPLITEVNRFLRTRSESKLKLQEMLAKVPDRDAALRWASWAFLTGMTCRWWQAPLAYPYTRIDIQQLADKRVIKRDEEVQRLIGLQADMLSELGAANPEGANWLLQLPYFRVSLLIDPLNNMLGSGQIQDVLFSAIHGEFCLNELGDALISISHTLLALLEVDDKYGLVQKHAPEFGINEALPTFNPTAFALHGDVDGLAMLRDA